MMSRKKNSNRPPALADRRDADPVDEANVPIVEEQLSIGKRMREGRTVTVTNRPVKFQETVSVPLRKEHVEVERFAIGRVVDRIPDVREEDGLTIIPVVEERLIIQRELVLVEEVHLRRISETVQEEHTFDLRRTAVDIDE